MARLLTDPNIQIASSSEDNNTSGIQTKRFFLIEFRAMLCINFFTEGGSASAALGTI